eukprot:3694341-Rhodomonas_salina.5
MSVRDFVATVPEIAMSVPEIAVRVALHIRDWPAAPNAASVPRTAQHAHRQVAGSTSERRVSDDARDRQELVGER